ncbi:hypothetical protein R3I94_020946 [Phoxinus phoxinus]
MLITLCYLYLWLRFQRCYTAVIRGALERLSGGRRSLSFRELDREPSPGSPQSPSDAALFLELGDKGVYISEPQACEDLSKWTLLGSSLVCGRRLESVAFIIEASSRRRVTHTHTSQTVLNWSDYCLPLACSPGQPYRAVAEASLENFGRLGVAFMEDRLRMDNGLVPEKIVSVSLRESALTQLLEKRRLQANRLSEPVLSRTSRQEEPELSRTSRQEEPVLSRTSRQEEPELSRTSRQEEPVLSRTSRQEEPELSRTSRQEEPVLSRTSRQEEPELSRTSRQEEPVLSRTSRQEEPELSRTSRQEKPELSRTSCQEEPVLSRTSCQEEPELSRTSHQEEPELPSDHQHMEGHHLHLSSCHECLELENSTIQSVRFASAENIPDLVVDGAENIPDLPDEEENIPDLPDSESVRLRSGGKPPNVLVFTGGCDLQYRRIRSLLTEVLDPERYTIYPLRPQPALSEPWPENTLLLVLGTGPLTPQLILVFLAFLSRGGRVLGLSCSLCPAGVTLRPRAPPEEQICRLSFTRADGTELRMSVVSSGSVYEREEGGAEVELWGEITEQDQPEMAIVRLTHGPDSGQAVLSQVRLEADPDVHDAQGFSELKMSNSLRYEVLTEILRTLGLSCERSTVPTHTPIYLLITHQEQKQRLLHCWTGGSAVLTLRAGAEPDLGERGSVCVINTDPPESFSEHFSLHTYRQHLHTHTLGHTLIYADVTSSTMDLLDGLVSQSPQEGLIAIAARQTQGKGRGGNAWLSPLGCAMFSLHLQIPLNSRLGQRLPFLQHLVALAVVESVRTLPGYEDVDLRLKWPNDIYYSDLMKLGGVLVSSSLTGQSFSLRIGCGFNVSNSNPTVCINDLVRQQNRQQNRGLEPLAAEQLIARAVTLLERYVSDFQLRGSDTLLPLYYSRWVHGGSRVRLWSEDGPEAEVRGLDESGFLQVWTGDEIVTLQPDGNSFDMMKNLVVTKSR